MEPANAALVLEEVLRRTHLSAPDQLAAIVAESARSMGAEEVVLYLVDYELKTLLPVPAPDAAGRDPLSVGGTVAGRAFMTTTILEVDAERSGGDASGRRLWIPLIDGTERVGAMEMTFPEASAPLSENTLAWCERYAHLVAMLLLSKSSFSDCFEVLRRRRPVTIASELIRELVPPLVFATDDLVIAGLLEPAYDNGGDALDFALNEGVLHFAVFDAMGHGLPAAGVAAFALSAYRHSRRHDDTGLEATYVAMDAAVHAQYEDARFVTALLAQLEVASGRLRWVSAGHPAPLLLRAGRLVKALDVHPAPPIGLQLGATPHVSEESLQPGDLLLLYTDGLTEARRPGGDLFTVERLAEFIERQAAAAQTAPETLRRLRHAIIDRQEGALRDDATALLLEWRTGRSKALLPQTV